MAVRYLFYLLVLQMTYAKIGHSQSPSSDFKRILYWSKDSGDSIRIKGFSIEYRWTLESDTTTALKLKMAAAIATKEPLTFKIEVSDSANPNIKISDDVSIALPNNGSRTFDCPQITHLALRKLGISNPVVKLYKP